VIRDIRGVHCPMGCGETLHLMQTDVILCLKRGCPKPDAAHQLLSGPETEHVVAFGTDSLTVIHPLRDRLGDLPFCPVHEACNRLNGPPGGIPGRYRVKMDNEGGLIVEPLDGTPAPN
jgi:hypothetical protein